MLKRLGLAALLGVATASGALAQTAQAPSDPDQCMSAAYDLAQRAEERNLSETDLGRIEEMLTEMEEHCDARKFEEATAMAKEIEAEINAK